MLTELEMLDLRTKKFYTTQEILAKAAENGKDYCENKRNLGSKLAHLFLPNQQTANDLKYELIREQELDSFGQHSILEQAGLMVKYMLKAEFCNQIISVRTNEYELYFNELKHRYLKIARKFIQEELNKGEGLISSDVFDALQVLHESGDSKADTILLEYELLRKEFEESCQKVDKSINWFFENQGDTISIEGLEHSEIIRDFIQRYGERDQLRIPEFKSRYDVLYGSAKKYRRAIDTCLDHFAWKEPLIFNNPTTEERIVIFKDPVIEIGRSKHIESLVLSNRINLSWKRISRSHLLINFEKGIMKDLNSSNGTYINKRSKSPEDKIEAVQIEKVVEFNLALDMTFSVFQAKDDFKGFHFLGFSTEKDNTTDGKNYGELKKELERTWFVYVPEDKILSIRKKDGKPVYGDFSSRENYQIKILNDKYYYTDTSRGIFDKVVTISQKSELPFDDLTVDKQT